MINRFISLFLKNNLNKVRTVSTYSVVGIGTAIGYFLLYIFLVEYFYFSPFWAAVIGYIPGIPISYLLCYFWVFKSSKNLVNTSFKFFTVNILGYILNFVGIFILVDLFTTPYVLAQLMLFIVVAIHNYLLNYFWTFSAHETN